MQKILYFYVAPNCKWKGGAGLVWRISCEGWRLEELEHWLSWPSTVPVKSLAEALQEGTELKICFVGPKELLLLLCENMWREAVWTAFSGMCPDSWPSYQWKSGMFRDSQNILQTSYLRTKRSSFCCFPETSVALILFSEEWPLMDNGGAYPFLSICR